MKCDLNVVTGRKPGERLALALALVLLVKGNRTRTGNRSMMEESHLVGFYDATEEEYGVFKMGSYDPSKPAGDAMLDAFTGEEWEYVAGMTLPDNLMHILKTAAEAIPPKVVEYSESKRLDFMLAGPQREVLVGVRQVVGHQAGLAAWVVEGEDKAYPEVFQAALHMGDRKGVIALKRQAIDAAIFAYEQENRT